jgi:hypothetical protein
MGWLIELVSSQRAVGKKLAKLSSKEKAKRMALWKELLSNYKRKEAISRHFSPGNIEEALRNWDNTLIKLGEIESLIPHELVSIEGEEKLEEEILRDIERLMRLNIREMFHNISNDENRLSEFIRLLNEINNFLVTELHLIMKIRGRPPNVKGLLRGLFSLIFQKEEMLYEVFAKECHPDNSLYKEIHEFARAVILHEEIKERVVSEEEKFANLVLQKMSWDTSRNTYRKLGEALIFELAEKAGAPLRDPDEMEEGIKKMKRYIRSDDVLRKVILKFKPKFSEMEIQVMVWAFRKAFDNGYFEEIAEAALYEL